MHSFDATTNEIVSAMEIYMIFMSTRFKYQTIYQFYTRCTAPWYDWITGYVYKIQWFQFRKMHLKMLSAKWQPFYPGLNVLKENYLYAINSSLPCAAYMPHGTGSALIQAMACRLLGAKPLHEPMLAYYRLDFWQQISVKFKLKFYHFHSRKCIWRCCLPNGAHFVQGRWLSARLQ